MAKYQILDENAKLRIERTSRDELKVELVTSGNSQIPANACVLPVGNTLTISLPTLFIETDIYTNFDNSRFEQIHRAKKAGWFSKTFRDFKRKPRKRIS